MAKAKSKTKIKLRKSKTSKKPFLHIGGNDIGFGKTVSLTLPVSDLYTDSPVELPVRVITGKKPGPILFITGAVHGDEIIGVEIVRRLLQSGKVDKLNKGALILVPIVNLFGFILNSRYLPDRRDLNRSFPGTAGGSLASRVAYILMSEIVKKSTHGIDIHSGSFYRENLPQIRADTECTETMAMAEAFGASIVINSDVRDGSLREAAQRKGVKMLVFEAGEALRFDETSAAMGLNGILGVMEHLGMIKADIVREPDDIAHSKNAVWVRAPRGGILWDRASLGAEVKAGDILGYVSDPFGDDPIPILAPENGILVGRSNLPTANEGDGLFHIATFKNLPSKEEIKKDAAAIVPESQENALAVPDH
ncbi:MAG: succinylglutamate desuccinylase/aspartoacylase family protein [Alphaproteobacteria bacterium]|nr:MAG: succinylglutamate desuccinylase/aspartoacylase family protein [Alphaproteobacteria bacterium]